MDIFSAMSMIEKLYFKIILIDVTEDTFQEIKIESEDKPTSTSFTKWWKDFAAAGRVHQDDMERYLDYINHMTDNSALYYRRLDKEGNWRWVYAETIPCEGGKHLMFTRTGTLTGIQRAAAIKTLDCKRYYDVLTDCRNKQAYDILINNIGLPSHVIYVTLKDTSKKSIATCAKCFKQFFNKDDIYYDQYRFVIITQLEDDKFEMAISQLHEELYLSALHVDWGWTWYDGSSCTLLESVREAKRIMIANSQGENPFEKEMQEKAEQNEKFMEALKDSSLGQGLDLRTNDTWWSKYHYRFSK